MRAIALTVVLCTAVFASAAAEAQQAALEARYVAARDSAIESLVSRVKGGEKFDKYKPVHDSVLTSLADRLRVILGPVHAKGFSGSGRGNLETLFPGDEGFGMLDALVFKGDDGASELWVTTRSLTSHRGRGIKADLATAFRDPAFYTQVVSTDAAVWSWGEVAVPDAQRLGIAEALMMVVAQDITRGPPEQLLVTITRGQLVYIVTAPFAVTIQPPRECIATLDSVYARADPWWRRRPTNAVDSAASRRALRDADAAEPAFRKCYGDRAPMDPRFARVVAQVRSIAAALP